jgi:hypothetical protein
MHLCNSVFHLPPDVYRRALADAGVGQEAVNAQRNSIRRRLSQASQQKGGGRVSKSTSRLLMGTQWGEFLGVPRPPAAV